MRPCHLCASVGLTRLRTFPAWISWGAALGLHSSPKGAPGAAAIPRSGPLGESDKEEVPGSGWLGTGLNPRPGRSLEAAPDLDAGRGGRKARGAGMPAGARGTRRELFVWARNRVGRRNVPPPPSSEFCSDPPGQIPALPAAASTVKIKSDANSFGTK